MLDVLLCRQRLFLEPFVFHCFSRSQSLVRVIREKLAKELIRFLGSDPCRAPLEKPVFISVNAQIGQTWSHLRISHSYLSKRFMF